MRKSEALSHFGTPEAEQAERVALMAAALGITRTAIYMWDEDEIPELRALQVEKIVAGRERPGPAEPSLGAAA